MKTMTIIIICLLICGLGCTSKFIWTDDTVSYSGSLLSWGKVDDLAFDANNTHVRAGGVKYRTDANAVEAVASGVMKGIKK